MTKKLVFAVITARANASEQIQLVEGIMLNAKQEHKYIIFAN